MQEDAVRLYRQILMVELRQIARGINIGKRGGIERFRQILDKNKVVNRARAAMIKRVKPLIFYCRQLRPSRPPGVLRQARL